MSELSTKNVEEAMVKLHAELEVYRNEVLEEVAHRLEKEFTVPFGADTIASFAAYIRSMKRETK